MVFYLSFWRWSLVALGGVFRGGVDCGCWVANMEAGDGQERLLFQTLGFMISCCSRAIV